MPGLSAEILSAPVPGQDRGEARPHDHGPAASHATVFAPASFGFKMPRYNVSLRNVMYRRLLGDNATTEIHDKRPAFRIEQVNGDRKWGVVPTAHTPVETDFAMAHHRFWSWIPWLPALAPISEVSSAPSSARTRIYGVRRRDGLVSKPKLVPINAASTQAR